MPLNNHVPAREPMSININIAESDDLILLTAPLSNCSHFVPFINDRRAVKEADSNKTIWLDPEMASSLNISTLIISNPIRNIIGSNASKKEGLLFNSIVSKIG